MSRWTTLALGLSLTLATAAEASEGPSFDDVMDGAKPEVQSDDEAVNERRSGSSRGTRASSAGRGKSSARTTSRGSVKASPSRSGSRSTSARSPSRSSSAPKVTSTRNGSKSSSAGASKTRPGSDSKARTPVKGGRYANTDKALLGTGGSKPTSGSARPSGNQSRPDGASRPSGGTSGARPDGAKSRPESASRPSGSSRPSAGRPSGGSSRPQASGGRPSGGRPAGARPGRPASSSRPAAIPSRSYRPSHGYSVRPGRHTVVYRTVRPYHGVFVYGPRPVYHTRYVTVGSAPPPARVVVQESHLPKRTLNRENTLAVGLSAGSYLSGYKNGDAYGDLSVGVTARYRPVEAVGLEGTLSHSNQTWSAQTERAQTMGQASVMVFATPWSRVSPYALVGGSVMGRKVNDMAYDDTVGDQTLVKTGKALAGVHGGLGVEFGIGEKVALDLEARYTGWIGKDASDRSFPGALSTNIAVLYHF